MRSVEPVSVLVCAVCVWRVFCFIREVVDRHVEVSLGVKRCWIGSTAFGEAIGFGFDLDMTCQSGQSRVDV